MRDYGDRKKGEASSGNFVGRAEQGGGGIVESGLAI